MLEMDSWQVMYGSSISGIWRFAEYLPPMQDAEKAPISLGEGNTPLIQSAHVGPGFGLPNLYFKVEGANPTGSYKDRIAAVGISLLVAAGKRAWAATSSGNAGAAIAAYGVRAGIPGYLFTLEKASRAKIAQILSYGPQVMAVNRLGYDPDVEAATWANIQALCQRNNWMMLVTARAFSPDAMDGAMTIAFELCEAFSDVPDVVVVPVGGGGLLSSIWKGFKTWYAAGLITRLPRLVAVQAQGCDPVVQAWKQGTSVQPIPTCESAISGIQLTAPPDGDLALAALHESEGWAVAISDKATYTAQAELAQREGIFVEPAAAITLAAARDGQEKGYFDANEHVVCVLTGTGFKDASAVARMVDDIAIQKIDAPLTLPSRLTRRLWRQSAKRWA